jgi:hypothetical protein
MYKKLLKYYSRHPLYTIFVNLIIGLGLGIIISRPLGVHPVRYGLAILVVGILGKLYPLIIKEK